MKRGNDIFSRRYTMERIENNKNKSPDKIILSDAYGEYTNQQLWDESGRVYAYLLEQGVGREDVVLVHLPRCAEAVMVLIGVLRVGAAAVVMEDWGENAWVDYVKNDVAPRITIKGENMALIRKMKPKEGYRLPDLHDLAYIVYTTGTTGQSKGVMHEYGTIERYWPSEDAAPEIVDVSKCSLALTVTLHTGTLPIILSLGNGAHVDIVPFEVFNDWPRFLQRLEDKGIVTTYTSPVFYQKHGVPQTSYLKYVSVSFEPACGIYNEGTILVNEYGCSETGSTVAWFMIDKQYDITPIGKPVLGFNISILDENDQPVPDGELGEICVDNIYCRGYLNLPEVTKEHFRNGQYHTHDLGKRMPDGNYIMYGRMNDALKTSAGLIIALEIEVAARKVLGCTTAYVKIFPTDKEPVICLYTDFPIDFPKVQFELSNIIQSYKVPTDHVQVEKFEYKNGKAIRVHLKNPRQ